MRIAVFVGGFPVVSETFILRQITGLIDLGHSVEIFATTKPAQEAPVQPEVRDYELLSKTAYMTDYIPDEAGYWEMPLWPVSGETWLPGAEEPISNATRALQAVPVLIECLSTVPLLAMKTLDPAEYGAQAASLSALYRLRALKGLEREYDVLHAHFGPVGSTFRFARDLYRAPMIVSFHGYDFSTWPRLHGTDVYERLFDTVDAVTVNSDYTRTRVERLGCSPSKVYKLPVGLDPDYFEFQERRPRAGEPIRILTVARLVEIKGLEYSIRAVAQVRQRCPGVRYDIIGDGTLRNELQALIEELSVKDVVVLHGARDREYVRQKMSEAQLFVLTSVNTHGDEEGQGLALQEAQAAGLPVIATDHGAFPEGILQSRSGFLVPERDVGALADCLVYLIRHPELWPGMGREGRRFVEQHYDVRHLNGQLVELYEHVRTAYDEQHSSSS